MCVEWGGDGNHRCCIFRGGGGKAPTTSVDNKCVRKFLLGGLNLPPVIQLTLLARAWFDSY